MKRYNFGAREFYVQANGDWVLWADVQQLLKENIVLRNELNAARMLGDASPLALEYAREQWLDARRKTDEFDKEPK